MIITFFLACINVAARLEIRTCLVCEIFFILGLIISQINTSLIKICVYNVLAELIIRVVGYGYEW